MKDHLHIMSDLHPTICLSDYVKDIKVASNTWLKESGKFPAFEGWQEGYAAFTYSIRERVPFLTILKITIVQLNNNDSYEALYSSSF